MVRWGEGGIGGTKLKGLHGTTPSLTSVQIRPRAGWYLFRGTPI